MRQKVKTTIHALFIAAFLGILASFAFLNAKSLQSLLKSADKSPDSWQESAASIETTLKERAVGRKKLIDLYGLSLVALDRDMVGNFEFVKDRNGIVQQPYFRTDVDSPDYIDSLLTLDNYGKSVGMPFVFLAQPDRTEGLPSAAPEVWSAYGQRSKRVGAVLREEGADCLDLEELMASDEEAPSLEEFYLKTDGHGTTYGEFWTAKRLAEHLNETYGLSFPTFETVFDLSNYDVKSYAFLGNHVRSCGRYFAGTDQFEIYHPNFETDLTYYGPTEAVTKTGPFDVSMLEGYEERDYTDYTYWIVNYGHHTVPYYEYTNNLAPAGAPDILVVCDSTFMRGFTYLALACRKLTVMDPRYFGGTEYLANDLALNRYDAVIVTGQNLNHKFAVEVSLPDLPQTKMITPEEYGREIADRGICPGIVYKGKSYEYDAWKKLGDGLPVDLNEDMVSIFGWAADFANNAPFQKLYLQVGKVLLPCSYGQEAQSVVDAYGQEALLNTSFTIDFPAEYLKNGEVREISFIGVSADGQYLYEPVTYQITGDWAEN